MDGFKNSTKIKYFKEGGSVAAFTKRDRKETDSAEIKQDKAIVKKAIAIHDKQEHPGEKTDLSKLKKGGRAKKAVGTVNKYKVGGTVTNVYEAKKSAGDKDNIRKVKDITPVKLCGGKSVKKMADGGILEAIKGAGVDLKNKVMGTPEQNRLALEREKRIRERQAALASGNQAAIAAQPSPTAPLPGAPAPGSAVPMPTPSPTGINAGAGSTAAGAQNPAVPGGMKKGGKAKRKC